MAIGQGRWETYARGRRPAGGRWPAVLVIAAVVLGALGWAARHPPEACSCGPQVRYGRAQPGFQHISGPVATALTHLSVHLQVATTIGVPVGVYRSGRFALVLYGRGSRFGVFRFTAQRRRAGFGRRSLDALARECEVCRDNRPVTGPAAVFSGSTAVAAARALARASGA